MPGVTGDPLAQEMMRIRQDIPVLLRTGYNDRMSAEKAASLGIRACLMKPLDRRDLCGTIRRALEGP
jgi:DNA-binding NtrC family response regulator